MLYRNIFKRISDFIFGILLVIISSPIWIIITIVLCFQNKGKPFFMQERAGKNNKVFTLYKFKTMTDATDENGKLLDDNKRLTQFGIFLRLTSLDEIPQLINIIFGHMSFIGPRPLLVPYIPLYDSKQIRRHEVRPGITGWAQVNGRNKTPFSKRFEYDVWYVDNLTLNLDVKIILLTIKKVFTKEGNIPGQDVKDVDDLDFNIKINEK